MDLKKTSKFVLSISVKIVFWIICAGVFIFICSKAFSFGHLIFSNEGMAAEGEGIEITVTIPEGADASEVADILADAELIESKYAFIIQTKIYEADAFQAGDYTISTEDGPETIIEMLSQTEETQE